ncbi:hypothetical protein NE237_013579 [Protea cynaroides]|uniref:Uncharacterized protein n=1 Tax=Protea cynaroides TaxID=273540 RepID=A0A9Q0GZ02_9MAGN|nr:hypothetical protein NE237_013579 [Protea cynaroides]
MIVFRDIDTLNNSLLSEKNAKENRVEPITRDGVIVVGKVEGIVGGDGELWFSHFGNTSSSRTLIHTKRTMPRRTVWNHYRGWNQRCRQRRRGLTCDEELQWKIRMSHKGKGNHALRLK